MHDASRARGQARERRSEPCVVALIDHVPQPQNKEEVGRSTECHEREFIRRYMMMVGDGWVFTNGGIGIDWPVGGTIQYDTIRAYPNHFSNSS